MGDSDWLKQVGPMKKTVPPHRAVTVKAKPELAAAGAYLMCC
jgi:hypothetical protein